MDNNILAQYRNGDVDIILYNDGTKKFISETGEYNYEYPTSVDLKISNWCALGCNFCSESSTIEGKEGDYDFMISTLKQLPAGTEIALGGGETLSYSRLVDLLTEIKAMGLIANLTTNQGNMKTYYHVLEKIVEEKLIYGLGISITSNNYTYIQKIAEKTDNIVFNIICGVHQPTILDEIAKYVKNPKFTILGYKNYGMGKSYFSPTVENNIKSWYMKVPIYLGKYLIAFDNLGIEQMNMKRMFTEEAWNEYFIGNEGSHSMYIDGINCSFAINSRTEKSEHKKDISIKDYFAYLKTIS